MSDHPVHAFDVDILGDSADRDEGNRRLIQGCCAINPAENGASAIRNIPDEIAHLFNVARNWQGEVECRRGSRRRIAVDIELIMHNVANLNIPTGGGA